MRTKLKKLPDYPTADEINKAERLLETTEEHLSQARSFAILRIKSAIELGQTLLDWKERLGRGNFQSWLAKNFTKMSTSGRCNYMRLAEYVNKHGVASLKEAPTIHKAMIIAQVCPPKPKPNGISRISPDTLLFRVRQMSRRLSLYDIQKLTEPKRLELLTALRPIVEAYQKIKAKG